MILRGRCVPAPIAGFGRRSLSIDPGRRIAGSDAARSARPLFREIEGFPGPGIQRVNVASERLPSRSRSANGARGRTRTGTRLPSRDFKSLASTNFATRAVRIDDVSAHLRFASGEHSNIATGDDAPQSPVSQYGTGPNLLARNSIQTRALGDNPRRCG